MIKFSFLELFPALAAILLEICVCIFLEDFAQKGSRVCFSWWKGQSLPIWSERMLGTWRPDRKLIPSLLWTRSASTSPVTFRRTAKSRKPTRNSAPWSFCWPALGWSAEKQKRLGGSETLNDLEKCFTCTNNL